MKKIIFYAPLGHGIPDEKIGGAEIGCRRTLKIYQKAGFDVICIEKPVRLNSIAVYVAKLLVTYANFIRILMLNPKSLVHIVGFYDKIIDIELALISTAKTLGHKTIYEIRNGGMVEIFNKRDAKYKRKQLSLFSRATSILCQGKCYVDFIKEKLGKDSLFYPNYIEDKFLKPWCPHNFAKGLQLIYFGRVTPSKNIDVVIQTAAQVQKKIQTTKLHIVGAITEDYCRYLESVIEEGGIPHEIIKFHGRKDFDYISKLLYDSHFFLFPSSEPNEGHSNSLTEAMGCGVVPIVSAAGFNAYVCDIPELIVDSLNPHIYTEIILKIMKDGNWNHYSQKVWKRATNNFKQSEVEASLVNHVNSLLQE